MRGSSSNGRRPSVSRLKTYSHLGKERRLPNEYELVTSRLLYYPERGFEVKTPLDAWYEKHQRGSLLTARDWERFSDPRETTYAKYTALALKGETYLDGVLESIQTTRYDRALSPEWRATLDRVIGPLRYPLHGFQMIAAYIGQMAPSGRITVAALFQAADEMRRIQRLAYRMTLLQDMDSSFGQESKNMWLRDPAWQPLREAVERCLVTYDWGESLVALNLCLKPLIDELFMTHLSKEADEHDDHLLGQVFSSLDEDCKWHRDWTVELLRTAVEDNAENRTVIHDWVTRWGAMARRAVAGFDFLFQRTPVPTLALSSFATTLLAEVGVEAPAA
jgi:toluene monooxygenase system protein E